MKDPVPLLRPRDPVEMDLAQQLLAGAGIVYSLRQPTSSLADVGGGSATCLPALLLVDRADVERARAALIEAWGSLPELAKPQ